MLSLFRRGESQNNFSDSMIVRLKDRSEERQRVLRDVQLLLHEQRIFPSSIDVCDDAWVTVVFYPSNEQVDEAADRLLALHGAGELAVRDAAALTPLGGWQATVRVARSAGMVE